jgi:hypothetical protein
MGDFNLDLKSNSGHHYYFIPIWAETRLGVDARARAELDTVFPSTCNQSALEGSILDALAKHPEWIWGTGKYTWLRMAFSGLTPFSRKTLGEKPFQVRGVWLCVETNTGPKGRGTVYHIEDKIDEAVASEYDKAQNRYVAEKPSDLLEEQTLILQEVFLEFKELSDKCNLDDCRIRIRWNRFNEQNTITARLVVDYGNSRTVAALLLNTPAIYEANRNQLSMLTKAVDLNSELQDSAGFLTGDAMPRYEDYIADSWMVLRRPVFDDVERKEPRRGHVPIVVDIFETQSSGSGIIPRILGSIRRILGRKTKARLVARDARHVQPFMFRELAPVSIGKAGYDLIANVRVKDHVNFFLSAPKRYCWDHDQVDIGGMSQWYMLNAFRNASEVDVLSGEVLRFMPLDFHNRFLNLPEKGALSPADVREGRTDNPMAGEIALRGFEQPSGACYPRADAMVWSALRIIEIANRYLQSEAHRERGAVNSRRLTEVVLTYPPGWTFVERQSFLDAWRMAANIFYWSRFKTDTNPVNVRLGLDEAVASQLPVVFSDIINLGSDTGRWLKLYGQLRNNVQTCRVLTIDIGGGTVDISVVEYTGQEQVARGAATNLVLKPCVLMTDSSYHAGDRLVKDLTEKVLLPNLCKNLTDKEISIVYDFFKGSGLEPVSATQRAVFNRTAFLPMIIGCLQELSINASTAKGGGVISLRADTVGCAIGLIDDLNRQLTNIGLGNKFWPTDKLLDFNVAEVRDVILGWLDPIIASGTFYIGGMGCDMVVVTGKPSEIEIVKSTLSARLPIDPNRVVFAKGFYAGDHLPLADKSKHLPDAKLMTVSGAIIKEAASADHFANLELGAAAIISDWKLERTTYDEAFIRNYWHVEALGGTGRVNAVGLMDPGDDFVEYTHSAEGSASFSRSKFKEGPREPVYELRKKPNAPRSAGKIVFRITRHIQPFQDSNNLTYVLPTERLELAQVDGNYDSGEKAHIDDWELRVRTLYRAHWLDDPQIERQFN